MKSLLIASFIAASAATTAFGDKFLACESYTISTCMGDSALISIAGSLLGICPTEGLTLSNGIAAAKTMAESDAAWNTFCGGTCIRESAKLTDSELHTCCLASFGQLKTMKHLKSACEMSTKTPTRRCGSELFNLGLVACNATDANSCTAMPQCEWVAPASMCLFKPTNAVLDDICTDCNDKFFKNYITGGINSYNTFTQMAAIYEFACSKFDGQYCLVAAADAGFRQVAEATAADLGAICHPTAPSSIAKRRCHRTLAAAASRGLVRSARVAYEKCNATDTECQTALTQTLTLANAVERAAAAVCATNANGTNCLGAASPSLATNPCLAQAVLTKNCTAECAATVATAVADTSCCGVTAATSGAFVARAAPAGRLLLANMLSASKNVNATAQTRMSNAAFKVFVDTAKGYASTNAFAATKTCSGFSVGFDSWSAQTTCPNLPPRPSRTYDVELFMSGDAYTNDCANKNVVLAAITADFATSIGITTAQITATTVDKAANGNLRVRFAFNADSVEEIRSIDLTASVAANFKFITTGVEIVNSCPKVLPFEIVQNPVVSALIATTGAAGEVPLPTTTAAPTTTTAVRPTTVNEASRFYSSMIATFALVIAVFVLIVS